MEMLSLLNMIIVNMKNINIVAFFDRSYNLLFHKKRCIKLNMWEENPWDYNDMFMDQYYNKYRYMGKKWYKIQFITNYKKPDNVHLTEDGYAVK